MAEKKESKTKKTPVKAAEQPAAAPKAPADGRRISVNLQYVKDLSFESPNAPKSIAPNPERPNIDVHVNVKAAPVQDNLFEVELILTASAKRAENVLFLVELSYAGIFTLSQITDPREREMILLVYCPSLLFPFARRIVADTTRDGGFPPLMLDPIDFAALHQRSKQKAQAAS